ncbi:MAG: hypothetical protein JSR54_00740 [Proteobacteria bacterium]|nr:hypothetical protein [Pseudomonadota bacterium]
MPTEASGSLEWASKGAISFVAETKGLTWLNAADFTARQPAGRPLIGLASSSPADGHVAIVEPVGTSEESIAAGRLYVWNPMDASPPKLISREMAATVEPQWSPSARTILARSLAGALMILTSDGRSQAILPRRSAGLAGGTAWLTDNSVIAIVGQTTLKIINIEPRSIRTLEIPPGLTPPVADGHGHAYFLQWTTRPRQIMEFDGSTVRPLGAFDVYMLSRLSTTGVVVGVARSDDAVLAFDLNSRKTARLAARGTPQAAAIDPSGRFIVYSSRLERGTILCVTVRGPFPE